MSVLEAAFSSHYNMSFLVYTNATELVVGTYDVGWKITPPQPRETEQLANDDSIISTNEMEFLWKIPYKARTLTLFRKSRHHAQLDKAPFPRSIQYKRKLPPSAVAGPVGSTRVLWT